jgi:hypothetical protein
VATNKQDEAYHTAGRIFPGPGEEGNVNFFLQEALDGLRLSAGRQQQQTQRPQQQVEKSDTQQQQQQQQPAGKEAPLNGASGGARRERRAALRVRRLSERGGAKAPPQSQVGRGPSKQ